MISQKDMRSVDRRYFNVLDQTGFFLTIQSKNTKHYWHILEQEYGRVKRYVVFHRHGDSGEYHEHGHAGRLDKIVADIKAHDRFQINVRGRR